MSRCVRCLVPLVAFLTLGVILFLFADRPVALALRDLDVQYPALFSAAKVYTNLGLGLWYVVVSGLGTLGVFMLLRWTKLRESVREKLQRFLPALGFFFVSTSIAGIVTNVIKRLVGRARPKLLASENIFGFHPLTLGNADWHSMPSGHSTTGFAVAFALAALFPRLRYIAFLFAITIACSRILVGAHYLSDVLMGALVGGLTVHLILRLYDFRGWTYRLDLPKIGKKLPITDP